MKFAAVQRNTIDHGVSATGHSHHFERARGVSVCPLLLQIATNLKLIKAARNGRYSHRDATLILIAFRHGLRGVSNGALRISS
jgi:hypothetical protein